MAISIVTVIAVNGLDHTLYRTLKSLAECTKPESYKATYIIENGQKHNAEEISKHFLHELQIKYYHINQGNKSAALNFALQQIDPDTLIFFTDDDGVIEKNTLIAYEEASKLKTKGFFFGGPTKAIYESTPPSWLIECLPPSAKGWKVEDDYEEYLKTPRFLGINWAAFFSDLQRVNGFNENLGPGTNPKRTGQEWDMQNRLLKAGCKAIYVEKAQVSHHVPKKRANFKWLLKRRFQGGFSAGILFVEEHSRSSIPLPLLKYLIKYLLLLPFCLLTFSRKRSAQVLADIAAGIGRLKGYLYAIRSEKY